MGSKRVVNFNEGHYNRKANELNNQVKSYNDAIKEASELTGLSISETNSTAVAIYAKNKTGFVDLSMSFKALGLNDVYNRLKLVELSGISEEDSIVDTDGILSLDKESLKDTYTTYFNEDDYELVDSLERVVEASKGISSYILSNAIQFSRDGGMSINKQRLNTVCQQIRRSQRNG